MQGVDRCATHGRAAPERPRYMEGVVVKTQVYPELYEAMTTEFLHLSTEAQTAWWVALHKSTHPACVALRGLFLLCQLHTVETPERLHYLVFTQLHGHRLIDVLEALVAEGHIGRN